VYVTPFAGGPFNASFLQNNVPVKLSNVPEVNGTRQVDVNQLVAGRLYVSYGASVNISVPFDSRTRFDWTEFTVTPSSSDVANLTRVDMFGIPMRLDTLDASGNVLETLSEANADAIFDALRAIPGGPSAVVRGENREIVRILSPNRAEDYPKLTAYVKAMNGQMITLQGRFFGAPQAVWNYSGTFERDGSITLNGSTNPPGQAPASIVVKGTQLIADIPTGGNTPNTAQGAIYRDLLAALRARGHLADREGRSRRVGEHRFAKRPRVLGAGDDGAAELSGARRGRVGVGDPEVGPPVCRLAVTGAHQHRHDVARHRLLGDPAHIAGQAPQQHRAERLRRPPQHRTVERLGAVGVRRV
jgi:hypothetical protein